jgi:predicted nucleotidyltransferase
VPDLAPNRAAIAALFRRFHVRRLHLLGLAAMGEDFDLAHSDLDLLVEYEPAQGPPALGDFLALREAPEALLGREVDLAIETAIRNPFVRVGISVARVPLSEPAGLEHE